MRAAGAVALVLALTGCWRAPKPYGSHAAFVPVVFRSRNPGRPPWVPKVVVTNSGPSPTRVRITRWPPDVPDEEERILDLGPGAAVSVPARIPLGVASSLLLESASPFTVTATIVDQRNGAPALTVPVLAPASLARPGDRLLVGPIVDDAKDRGHFCFTWPGAERDAVPFRVRVRLLSPGTTTLLHESTFVLTGLPLVIDNPWRRFQIPPGTPFDVDVTFLGSARGRPVAYGMWVYGISTVKATAASRFLPTRIVRASAH
jgi:hypothetical protein